uniref:Intercellular adhesion molecule N-terminal domain-containing protein n=1 Tax=Erpetoichthys calabaricus TaxID=27687 RepID=A0A8C4SYQ4_ERPCA
CYPPTTGMAQTCDVEFSPAEVIVKYGDPVTVTCRTNRTDIRAIGWETSVEPVEPKKSNSTVWNVSSLTVWDAEPRCFINFKAPPKQCDKLLNLIIYKLPSKVQITPQDSSTNMTEGRSYTLGCHIEKVAPSRYLQVMLYQGDQLLHKDSFPEDSNVGPVDKYKNWTIHPKAVDSGKEYKCVAQPEFGHQNIQSMQDSFTATILGEGSITPPVLRWCALWSRPLWVWLHLSFP